MIRDWTRIRSLFREAEGMPPSDWTPFLDRECGDDPLVREEVLRLLHGYDSTDPFLEGSAGEQLSLAGGPDASESLIGQMVGPYKILSRIAGGGMGVVYEGIDTQLDKKVALKTINPMLSGDAAFRDRFQREARLLAKIENPGIVRVYAIQDAGPATFMVLEHVDGISLDQFVRDEGSMSWSRAVRLGTQVLNALSAAHELGIVHRDVKPANIMLTRNRAGTEQVKVLDFGIAKMYRGQDVTMTATAPIGTLKYMAPERIKDAQAGDYRSDIYSVGLVLFKLMTGKLPFKEDGGNFAVQKAIVESPFDSLTSHVNDVPEALSSILSKALHKEPEHRYDSASEMAAELGLLANARHKKAPASRRKVVVLATAILAAGALFAFGMVQWFSTTTTNQSDATIVTESTADPPAQTEEPDERAAESDPGEPENQAELIVPDPLPTAADAPSPEVDRPMEPEVEPPVSQATPDPVPKETGQLFIEAPSPVDLVIDGVFSSRQASREHRIDVEPGDISVVARDSESGRSWTCPMSVRTGLVTNRVIDFSRQAEIRLVARNVETGDYERNVPLTVDGGEAIFTPGSVSLSVGSYSLATISPDFEITGLELPGQNSCTLALSTTRFNLDSPGGLVRLVVNIRPVG